MLAQKNGLLPNENWLNQLKNGLSKIGTHTTPKFVEYIKDFFDVVPLIEQAAFKTNRLISGVSIPPSIEIHFSRFKELSEEETKQILELYSDKKMFNLIFKALVVSNEFQEKLSSDTLVFSETCIEISIPPKISIKYLNKDISTLTKIDTDFD